VDASPLREKVATGEGRERVPREEKEPAATSPPEAPAETHRAEALDLTARRSGIRIACMGLPLSLGLTWSLEGRDVLGP